MVRLIPTDERFFELFTQLAERLTTAASLLAELFAEPPRIAQLADEIKDVEHDADRLTHEINERIDKTFVTPFDREDIHALAMRLDNVIDLIDGTARRAVIFRVGGVRAEARQMAEVLLRSSRELEQLVTNLKRPRTVLDGTPQVKLLEEEGDALYHDAVETLFLGHPDPLEVIKWKELFDRLEDAIDECAHAARTLESIALKNA